MERLILISAFLFLFSCQEEEVKIDVVKIDISADEEVFWFYILTDSKLLQGHEITKGGYNSSFIFREFERDFEIFCSKGNLIEGQKVRLENADCNCKIEVSLNGDKLESSFKYFLYER